MAENVMEFTDDNFEEEVLQADKPVLVDFWAEWCGPCKAIAPIVEQLAQDMGDKVKVGKVNVDNCRNTAMQYGISAIPTLIIFKDGEAAKKLVGMTSQEDLESAIEEIQ